MKKTLILFLLTGLLAVGWGSTGVAQEQKPLTFDDYSKWNRISRAGISTDGQWITYTQTPNGGDLTLFIKNAETDTLYTVAHSNGAIFSDDAKWAAYTVGVSAKEAKKLREARKDVPATGVLLNLATGEKQSMENINRYAFSNDSKHFVVHRKKAADDKSKHSGTDLILRNLEDGQLLNIGNVSQFAFNQAANRLAYTVDADAMIGNGLY
ncbi:MAG TPA: hypothetical protein VFD72_05880, partial [Sphingobacteriaceae bacterium]|nr:hypothetical protein [Sphingobacteriaceae bacterium]